MNFKERLKRLINDSNIEMPQNNLDVVAEKIESSFIQVVNSENNLEWVYIPDILYIDRNKESRGAILRTRLGIYKRGADMTYDMTLQLLSHHNFEVSDNRILVNMNEVKKYDGNRGRIYFDKVINDKSIFTYLSKGNTNKFKRLVGEVNDLSLNKENLSQLSNKHIFCDM